MRVGGRNSLFDDNNFGLFCVVAAKGKCVEVNHCVLHPVNPASPPSLAVPARKETRTFNPLFLFTMIQAENCQLYDQTIIVQYLI